MWKPRLFLILSLLAASLIFTAPVVASTTASLTVTGRGDLGLLSPPTNFTVTRVTDTEVLVQWTPFPSANTSIRVKYDAEPLSYNDGYLLYYGPGDNITDIYLNLDVMWSKMWYIAASYNGTTWSSPVMAYTGSPNVQEIANQLETLAGVFQDMEGVLQVGRIFEIILVFGMLYFALRTKDIVFYTVSSCVTLFVAFTWINDYTGVTAVMTGLGAYELFMAVQMAVTTGKPSRGWSHFKELINRFRGGG